MRAPILGSDGAVSGLNESTWKTHSETAFSASTWPGTGERRPTYIGVGASDHHFGARLRAAASWSAMSPPRRGPPPRKARPCCGFRRGSPPRFARSNAARGEEKPAGARTRTHDRCDRTATQQPLTRAATRSSARRREARVHAFWCKPVYVAKNEPSDGKIARKTCGGVPSTPI